MQRKRPSMVIAAVLLVFVFAFLTWQNSLAVGGISIRIKDGVKEHLDHSLPGIGSEHRAPDYKVKIRVNRRLLALDLGTHLNKSATNWITFAVQEVVPMRQLQEVIIIEDDKVENDVLDRIHGEGAEREGAAFYVRIETFRSFEAGMNWFFKTPIGQAITTAMILLVLFVLVRTLRLQL